MDKHAPLNVDYSYEVVSFADSGIYSTVSVPARIDTKYMFFYWDNKLARLKWNATESKKYKRPLKKGIVYAGRKHPVSYDSDNLEDKRSVSGVLLDRSEAQAFEAFMDNGGGTGVYKSLIGDVMHCDAEVSINEDVTSISYTAKVSASIERIDGDDL